MKLDENTIDRLSVVVGAPLANFFDPAVQDKATPPVAYHVAIGMMLALRAVNHKQIQALLKLMNGTPLDYQQAINSVRDILKAD